MFLANLKTPEQDFSNWGSWAYIQGPTLNFVYFNNNLEKFTFIEFAKFTFTQQNYFTMLIFYQKTFSKCTQLVKNPPAMQETWIQSLGWEDPLEKG